MGANEQLRIETQQRADRLILELHGELDMATSPQLAGALDELAQSGPSTIVLDLRGVSFLDSTGLKAIFGARNASRERGQQLAVTPGSPQVQRLLSLTRLGEHLTVIPRPRTPFSFRTAFTAARRGRHAAPSHAGELALSPGAVMMIVGGLAEILFAVKAERTGLESIAQPLTVGDSGHAAAAVPVG